MKKITITMLSVLFLFTFTACGVPQSVYDSLQTEYDNLKSENEILSTENDELKTQKQSTEEQLQYYKDKSEGIQSKLSTSNQYAKVWLDASFKNIDYVYFIENNKLFVNVFYDFITSKTLSEKMFKDYYDSIEYLGYIYREAAEYLSFDLITINFYDKNNNGLFSSSLSLSEAELLPNYGMISVQNFDIVLDALNSFTNK